MHRERTIDLMTTLQKVKFPSFVIDRNGTVTWLNDAATRVFGDLIGRSYTKVIAPEDVANVERQFEQKLRGTPVTDYEADVLTTDGSRRRAEISSVRIESGHQCHAIFGLVLPGEPRNGSVPAVSLTSRQNEVLQLLGEGASTDQIAAALHLSKETVRNHVRHVLRALGAHSRLEAVALAHRQRLLRND